MNTAGHFAKGIRDSFVHRTAPISASNDYLKSMTASRTEAEEKVSKYLCQEAADELSRRRKLHKKGRK